MNNNNITQKPDADAWPYLTIPLEVAYDNGLSDGTVLLLGEVCGIQRACGQCIASDTHFQSRRLKLLT